MGTVGPFGCQHNISPFVSILHIPCRESGCTGVRKEVFYFKEKKKKKKKKIGKVILKDAFA